MIILCNNCHKKFNIDSNLIPDNGRLLQCNSCNHKWFFKKEIINKSIESTNFENEETISFLDIPPSVDAIIDNKIHKSQNNNEEVAKSINETLSKSKKQKNYRILNLLVVVLISFVGLIITLDTFKSAIGKFFPNFEFLLYNLYETLKDITLFFKDLF